MGLGLVTCLADARRLGTPLHSSQVTNRYPVASDPSPGCRQWRNKVASNPASRVIRPTQPRVAPTGKRWRDPPEPWHGRLIATIGESTKLKVGIDQALSALHS